MRQKAGGSWALLGSLSNLLVCMIYIVYSGVYSRHYYSCLHYIPGSIQCSYYCSAAATIGYYCYY